MKENTVFVFLAFFMPFFFTGISIAETKSDVEFLPDITLTIPKNKEHRTYLGLKGDAGTPFKISEIDADILMIELFSMYCPYCQRAAPAVNELYEKIEQNKQSDLKLVLIGIGASNTDLEVDTFRKGFDIAFPLFPDQDLSIYKALAGEGTPGFIGCRKDGDGNSVVFFRKSGGFKDAPEFLDNLLDRSGLKQVDNASK